ncbi:MAG: hypothetical protein Q8P44_10265 [Dehalococcoidia bacterium]|nr:hypothetical protein [Dehalococcoidia bacterium]
MAVYSYKYSYEDPAKGRELSYERKDEFVDVAEMVDSLVEDLGKIPGENYVEVDIYEGRVRLHAWSDIPASEAIVLVKKLRGL